MSHFMRIAVYFVLVCLYILRLFSEFKKYRKEKDEFLNHLYDRDDTDTLYVLGIINKFGIRESRRVTYFSVCDKLWEKYMQTNDAKYLDFCDICEKYAKSKITFIILISVTSMISVVLGEAMR